MPLKDSVFFEDDDVPFPEVGYVFFWESNISQKFDTRVFVMPKNAKCSSIYVYIYIQLKLWKSCRRLNHLGGVFHVSVIGSCFVHFKVLRILWVLQFPSSACFYLNVAYPIGSVFCLRSSS